MKLDFVTLMTVMAANLFMISAVLPLIMGRDVSRAARHVQASLLLQAVGWAAIIASSSFWDQALSTLAIACQTAAQWALYRALEEWLGPRPLRRTLLVRDPSLPLHAQQSAVRPAGSPGTATPTPYPQITPINIPKSGAGSGSPPLVPIEMPERAASGVDIVDEVAHGHGVGLPALQVNASAGRCCVSSSL